MECNLNERFIDRKISPDITRNEICDDVAFFAELKDKHLLIVPSGALTQLPLQVLVTEPTKAAIPTSLAQCCNVAWLARQRAITISPAGALWGNIELIFDLHTVS